MEKTRAVHQLDTPFTVAEWPKISQQDQNAILDLLCNLLSPIGHHRKTYIQASKGKRSRAKKRKRDSEDAAQLGQIVPPLPAIASSVDVGLSHISRNLQLGAGPIGPETEAKSSNEESIGVAPYHIVFVARSGPPSAFFSHLPQMVASASKSRALEEPIRLVGFSKACEERLGACLGVPRVTSLAIRPSGTAQSKALVQFVRDRVPAVEAPWLDVAKKGRYQDVKIRTLQAPIGKKRQKRDQ